MPTSARFVVLRPHAQVMLLARNVASSKLPFVGLGVQEAASLEGDRPGRAAVEDLGLEPGDPQTLALAGTATLLPGDNQVEMGVFNEGDADDSNCVTAQDFVILKLAFGFSANMGLEVKPSTLSTSKYSTSSVGFEGHF